MRLSFNTILLLPSAVAANVLEAALKQPDTLPTPTDRVFAATQAQEALLAIQTSPPNLAASPHIGRSYSPNPAFLQPAAELQKREIVTGVAQGVGVTQNVGLGQVPSITTYWPETEVNGVATWLPVIYTQTFAAVPDQWPSAGVGSIGYGSGESTKNKEKVKREEEKRSAGSILSVSFGALMGIVGILSVAAL